MTGDADPPAELVISAPEPYASPLAYATRARTTLGVLTQLIADANSHVVLTAPFVQAQHLLTDGVLASAIDAALARGTHFDIMTTKVNLAGSAFQTMAKKHGALVRLYHPAFPAGEVSDLGSHAKFCICDRSAAYVGSANLTGPALGASTRIARVRNHFELGLLVRGRAAEQLHQFWRYMVDMKIFAQADTL